MFNVLCLQSQFSAGACVHVFASEAIYLGPSG